MIMKKEGDNIVSMGGDKVDDSTMGFEPIGDRLLAKELKFAKDPNSKIILPDTVGKDSFQMQVVAIGTGEEVKKHFKVGDCFLRERYGGYKVDFQGERHMIVGLADALGKFPKGTDIKIVDEQ